MIGWRGAAPGTRARLLKSFCSGIRSRSIISNSIAALIVGVFIIADTGDPIHVAWLVAALLGGLLPRAYAAHLRRKDEFQHNPAYKALVFVLLSAVYGSIWGVGPFLLLPDISGASVGVLLFILVFATVMGPYAAMPGILYARMLTTGLPTLVAIALYTDTELTIVATVLGAWLVLRTDVWRGYHRNLRQQMELRETLESQREELREANRAKQQANEDLKTLAETDPLTGSANRRQFMRFLEDLQGPASLLLFDIDHFKSINDTFGHHAGDTLLVDLAKLVHDVLRKEDLLARLGGDEFAVVLPGVAAAGAWNIAERIRESVDQHAIPLGTHTVHATISLGVASSVADARAVDPGTLLHDADVALYAAKHQGRNRIHSSEPSANADTVGA